MKKNRLFLSAAITTFILVILASVLMKARNGSLVSSAAAASAVPAATSTSTQAPTDTLQPTETATSVPTATGYITPQEAVFIASTALGNTQVYSVDTETRYGLDVYKVTFSSGHIVFVSPVGHILAIITPQAASVAPTPDQQSSGGGSRGKGSGGGGGGGGDGGGGGGGGDD